MHLSPALVTLCELWHHVQTLDVEVEMDSLYEKQFRIAAMHLSLSTEFLYPKSQYLQNDVVEFETT